MTQVTYTKLSLFHSRWDRGGFRRFPETFPEARGPGNPFPR
ncbi:hypothetical protein SBD_6140 [Streptomyces bottropensis ATCC 25435]|uniref:Uncharacterized protein n=1 Tax=Streptomyces bottropensis ATCC 25435 TaxID=1054862 RepID=M3D9U5_9ACTN|nr:hypothetical protein SBD_6140 [Streptomyces bottropensis ATCC 25435]